MKINWIILLQSQELIVIFRDLQYQKTAVNIEGIADYLINFNSNYGWLKL